MENILYYFAFIDWSRDGVVILRIAIAALCGGMIGLERGRHGRASGGSIQSCQLSFTGLCRNCQHNN